MSLELPIKILAGLVISAWSLCLLPPLLAQDAAPNSTSPVEPEKVETVDRDERGLIILRDLTLIEGIRIRELTPAGIAFSDGSHLQWEEILRGTVESKHQQRFDQLLNEVGTPTFRFRSRFRLEAWELAASAANQFPNPSKLPIEVRLQIAVARWKAKRLDREDFVVGYFDVMQIWYDLPPAQRNSIGRLPWAAELANPVAKEPIEQQVTPVFFDSQASTKAFNALSEMRLEGELEWRRQIYLTAFAIASQKWQDAERAIDAIRTSSEIARCWQALSRVHLELAQGNPIADWRRRLPRQLVERSAVQSVICWLECLEELGQKRPRLAPFLKTAALNKDSDPELAANALRTACQLLPEESKEFELLQQELLTRFPKFK